MKSIIAMMLLSILIISIPGNTANSQLDKKLPGRESKFLMFSQAKIDAATTESIMEDSGRRLTRSAEGGDGAFDSLKWLLKSPTSGNDVNTAIAAEPTQGNKNRLTRSAEGGDGAFDSLKSSSPGNDVSTPMVTEPTQGSNNRDQRHASSNIIGGDSSSGSDQFTTSTVTTTTDSSDYDKLHWKRIATMGLKEICKYDRSDIFCRSIYY